MARMVTMTLERTTRAYVKCVADGCGWLGTRTKVCKRKYAQTLSKPCPKCGGVVEVNGDVRENICGITDTPANSRLVRGGDYGTPFGIPPDNNRSRQRFTVEGTMTIIGNGMRAKVLRPVSLADDLDDYNRCNRQDGNPDDSNIRDLQGSGMYKR